MPAETRETIRPAVPGDVPALGALFEEVFGAPRPPEVWTWKYFGNPRGATSMVCEAEGRIVSHCGGAPVRFRDYGAEHMALQSVDFMSSPTYPGGIGRGGVFLRTAERFFDAYCGPSKVPLVYGFPGERHRVLGERLLGYRPVERVAELRLEARGEGRAIEPLTPGDLPLFGRVPLDLGALRDPVYLRWRYLDHPLWSYGKVSVRGTFGLGTQIAAVVRSDADRLHVMEVGGRFSRAAVEDLADALSRVGREVVLWGPPAHPVYSLFAEGGFSVTYRDHWIEMRSFTQRQVPRTGELYYTLGDYDVY
ncbi:MAG TPA: GNAT family N-acetyltransferase [Thermoanaerobaculia bacterium]